jgi:hypothetical protein
VRLRSQSKFNRASKVINQSAGKKVTFDYVVKRYAVTNEQLKADMENLRWSNEGGEIYFDLNQIRAKYQVDTDKLTALAALGRG